MNFKFDDIEHYVLTPNDRVFVHEIYDRAPDKFNDVMWGIKEIYREYLYEKITFAKYHMGIISICNKALSK